MGNALDEMVKYIVTGELGDNPGEETHRLSDIVDNVKDRSEVTKTYMKEWDRQRIHDRELTEQVTAQVTEKVTAQVTEEVTDSINRLNAILLKSGRLDDLEKSTENPRYQKKLLEELIDNKSAK